MDGGWRLLIRASIQQDSASVTTGNTLKRHPFRLRLLDTSGTRYTHIQTQLARCEWSAGHSHDSGGQGQARDD